MSNYLTHNGETHNISAWARKVGINSVTLQQRLHRGWTVEQALTAPICKAGERARAFTLKSTVKRYKRRHEAIERAFVKSLRRFIESTTKRNAMLLAGIDMSTIGQPAIATLTAPGVVGNFSESNPDRSLSSTQDSR